MIDFKTTPAAAFRLKYAFIILITVLLLPSGKNIFAAGNYSTWTACASGTTANITSVTYSGGTYVCICSNGMIRASSDGAVWDSVYKTADQPTDLVVSGGTFYACAGTAFMTSADGSAWTSTTFHGANPNIPYTIAALTPGINGELVGGGPNTVICSNDYGATWQNLQLGAIQAYFTKFTYLPATDEFVGMGSGGIILRISKSANGAFSFKPYGTAQTMYFSSLNYNPSSATWYGIIVNNVHYYWIDSSMSLNKWTAIDSGQGDISGVLCYNGVSLCTGALRNNSMPGADTNGVWSHTTLSGVSAINDIAYGDSTYAAVGSSGTVVISANGSSWTACSPATSGTLNKVIYAGGAFVAVGQNGAIIMSKAGTFTRDTRGRRLLPACLSKPGLARAFTIDGRELRRGGAGLSAHSAMRAVVRDGKGRIEAKAETVH